MSDYKRNPRGARRARKSMGRKALVVLSLMMVLAVAAVGGTVAWLTATTTAVTNTFTVGDINITVKTDAPTVEKKVLEDDKYNQDGGYSTGYNDVADYNMGDAVYFHLIGSVPDMSRYDTYKYIFHDTLSAGLTLNEDSIKV